MERNLRWSIVLVSEDFRIVSILSHELTRRYIQRSAHARAIRTRTVHYPNRWQEKTSAAILETRCDETPYHKDNDRPDDCADEASAFVALVPPDRLAKVVATSAPTIPSTVVKMKPLGSYLLPG